MMSYFYDILDEQALPPLQVGVWIPKTKLGPEADNFRPLGMPNTLDRLVDGTVTESHAGNCPHNASRPNSDVHVQGAAKGSHGDSKFVGQQQRLLALYWQICLRHLKGSTHIGFCDCSGSNVLQSG